tara:strand:- start:179 stop:367 length:189 start_codon:yes stop_codon:yes gene_type:complete
MDPTLDMQVAALIFLAGTKSLVTSEHPGGVEMTSEEDEDSEEPEPSNILQMHEPLNYGSLGI